MNRLGVRPGGALVLALLLLIVLDCVVLGTLHVAMLERRIVDNAATALRLRLAARSAVHVALAHWSAALDTAALRVPVTLVNAATTTDGLSYAASVERLASALYLVRGEAAARTGAGRATALLLIRPPALSTAVNAAPAALSAAGSVHIAGEVRAAAAARCAASDSAALRVSDPTLISMTEDGLVEGTVAWLAPHEDLARDIARILALLNGVDSPALRTAESDLRLDQSMTGVLVVQGSVTVPAGTHFRGLIIAAGTVTVEPGAIVEGAVHTAAGALIEGTLTLDPCAVTEAIATTRLHSPRPHPPPAVLSRSTHFLPPPRNIFPSDSRENFVSCCLHSYFSGAWK